MLSLRYLILALLFMPGFFTSAHLSAQMPEWVLFNTNNSGLPDDQIQSIAIDNRDVVWIGTAHGLARFDGANWTMYDSSNSDLPDSYVRAIATDKAGNVWIATPKGVSRFDGANWVNYSMANSPLPGDDVANILVDGRDRVWIATAKGAAVVDGANWTVYNADNSIILDDIVLSIAVDSAGVVWMGTFDTFGFRGYLISYDGTEWKKNRLDLHELPSTFPDALAVDEHNVLWMGGKGTTGGALVRVENGEWTVFADEKSGYPGGGIQAVAPEGADKWLGTSMGLVRYDGKSWAVHNRSNSGISEDIVTSIVVDSRGNKWVGTLQGGVAAYKEDGVVTSIEVPDDAKGTLLGNIPNPYSASTRIRYSLDTAGIVSLTVYDLSGREVAVLVDGFQQAGVHEIALSAVQLPTGTYVCSLRAAGRIETRMMVKVR